MHSKISPTSEEKPFSIIVPIAHITRNILLSTNITTRALADNGVDIWSPKDATIMPKLTIAVSSLIASCLALLVYIYLFDITFAIARLYITNLQKFQVKENKEQAWEKPDPDKPIVCDRNHFYYNICYVTHPTILDPKKTTFYTSSTHEITEKIRPHPRIPRPRILNTPIYLVKELTLTTAPSNVSCTITHHSPALIFSTGGWNRNFWHDIADRLIPLFITVETFFPKHDFILGIFDYNDWWARKYTDLLSAYTSGQIINLDGETAVHCFPSVIVGLVSHGPTAVDPIQNMYHPKTIRDFRAFFKGVYARNESFLNLPWKSLVRPRLVIVNREGPRSITNINQVQKVAEEIGFEVNIFVPSDQTTLHEAFSLIDSSHALIGVHGAALSNILFLRTGSIFMQIVPPKCGFLEHLCFGKMANKLGLDYMIYDVGDNESVLEMDQKTKEWVAQLKTQMEIWAVYKNQILKLDIMRFERYLKKAYEKAVLFMYKQKSEGLKRGSSSKPGDKLNQQEHR